MNRATILGLIALLPACSGQDSDYYPYRMDGMDVWVYTEQSGDQYAGFIAGGYFDREETARQCGLRAADFASVMPGNPSWSYVCCTVTDDSRCVTKVR